MSKYPQSTSEYTNTKGIHITGRRLANCRPFYLRPAASWAQTYHKFDTAMQLRKLIQASSLLGLNDTNSTGGASSAWLADSWQRWGRTHASHSMDCPCRCSELTRCTHADEEPGHDGDSDEAVDFPDIDLAPSEKQPARTEAQHRVCAIANSCWVAWQLRCAEEAMSVASGSSSLSRRPACICTILAAHVISHPAGAG